MNPLSTEVGTTGSQGAFWQHLVAVALIFGFAGLGWLRLNDCDLFNPDSPRYVIYAQSIAQTGQYRATDAPGAPLYAWRPPGLPILIAPFLRFRPYDVVAAKVVVLLLGSMLLGIVHLITSRRGSWTGPLLLAVVGSSPMYLVMSTEVLTEVPYTLGILVVVYFIGRWDESTTRKARWSYLTALAALAFTPIIRTVGVALIAGAGLWCLTSRRRIKFVPAVTLSILGVMWLSWRSRYAPGSDYAGSIVQTIRNEGLMAALMNAWSTTTYYASVFPGVLFPGLTNEQPFYAPLAVGALSTNSGLGGLTAFLSAIVVVLGLIGMCRHHSPAGLVALFYVPFYCACLSIWPWRHERFLWPLVPLFWSFAPSGAMLLSGLLPHWPRRLLTTIAGIALMSLAVGQTWMGVTLIDANQRYLANRDQFLRDEAPGPYFGGWRKAGGWIRDNTPAQARLLTWQAAVGGTAHRFQRRLAFETLTPEKIHQHIASFSARYLVVNDSQFGAGFGWQQVSADPAYTLQTIYRDQNVAVLEVEPNRTGQISRTAFQEWVANQTASLDSVLAHSPNRPDLLARKAELIQDGGDTAGAIAILEGLISRGVVTVRVCSALGWLYFEEQRYGLAARYLDLARGLPNAEQISDTLAQGAQLARERLNESVAETEAKSVERSLRRIQLLVSSLHLARAERIADQLIETAPDNAAVVYWRGYLHHLFAENAKAEPMYVRAIDLGSEEARAKLRLLRMSQAMEGRTASVIQVESSSEPVDPTTLPSHIQFAQLLMETGWSGRALAVLEQARERFGDQPEILSKLADLYMRYARPEEAAPLYRLAQQEWPHEKTLRQGLATAEAALRKPRFFINRNQE